MTKTKRTKSRKPAQKEDPDHDRSSSAQKEIRGTNGTTHVNATSSDMSNRRSPRLQSTPKKITKPVSTGSSTTNTKGSKGTKRKRESDASATSKRTPPSKRQKTKNEQSVVRIDLLDESPLTSPSNKSPVKKSSVVIAPQSPIKQRKPKTSISTQRKAAPVRQKRAKSKTVRKPAGKPRRVLPKMSNKKSALITEEETAESDQIDNSSESSKLSQSSKSSKSPSSKSSSNSKSSSESNSDSKSDKRSRNESSAKISNSSSSKRPHKSESSPKLNKSKSNSDQSDESNKESKSASSEQSSDSGEARALTKGAKSKADSKKMTKTTATKSVKSSPSTVTKTSASNGKARAARATKKNEDNEQDIESARLDKLDNEISKFMPLLVSIMNGKKQTPRAKQWNQGLKARSQMHYKVHMGGFASGEVDDILSIVQRKIMKMHVPDSVQRGGVSHFILDVLWPELAVLLLAARKSVSKKEAEQLFTADNDLEDEWIKTLKQSPERKAATIVILD